MDKNEAKFVQICKKNHYTVKIRYRTSLTRHVCVIDVSDFSGESVSFCISNAMPTRSEAYNNALSAILFKLG